MIEFNWKVDVVVALPETVNAEQFFDNLIDLVNRRVEYVGGQVGGTFAAERILFDGDSDDGHEEEE